MLHDKGTPLPRHWRIRNGVAYRQDGVEVRLGMREDPVGQNSKACFVLWEILIPHHYGNQGDGAEYEIRTAPIEYKLLDLLAHVDNNCPMLTWKGR